MTALNRAGGRVSPWVADGSLEAAQARASREHTNPAGCPICPPELNNKENPS